MTAEQIDFIFLRGASPACFAKGHIPPQEFMAALRREVNEHDPILGGHPEHCWLRYCRDFQEGTTIVDEAAPNSRGAFKATWIEI